MGKWYVRFDLGEHYREVWAQADSKAEALELADRQNIRLSAANGTPLYPLTRVECVDAPKRRLFRRK